VKLPSARHKGVWGSGRAAPRIFKLNNERSLQFHVWVTLLSGKESRYAFKRRFCGPPDPVWPFILFYFILFYFILFYFILFYFILFYFILFYFILFYFFGEEIYAKPLLEMEPKFLGSPARSLVTVLTELPGSICQLR
jgi:hypothetical protein